MDATSKRPCPVCNYDKIVELGNEAYFCLNCGSYRNAIGISGIVDMKSGK